jgi:hypothetical protein
LNICNNTGNDISLTSDRADDRSFAGTNAAGSAAAATFIPKSIFGQAANESFVNFNNAAKLPDVLQERDSAQGLKAEREADPGANQTRRIALHQTSLFWLIASLDC